jgi:dTDP-4-amino-4,6-dideoxygalactose transaminase
MGYSTLKTSLSELAIFGGAPAFAETLHVGRPNIGDRERLFARFNDLLDRKWLTNNGPYVQEFEKQIAAITGVKHCVAVCNATAGLEVLAHSLGMHGEVIVPSFTFIATAHALRWLGIKPVFCDIDPCTHNLDPNRVEALITPLTTGILAVHTWGRGCDDAALRRIADRHNLRLLYDAAHAFACSYRGQMIGNLGDGEVFSFHATKFVNSFEGGAITTNDDALAGRLRAVINFGYDPDDEINHLGINAKMSEASAAMGITGLESLDEVVARNSLNYKAYRRELGMLDGFKVLAYDETEKNNFQYIVVEVDADIAGIDRNTLVKVLHAENVLARKYFYPGCHMAEPYRTEQPEAARSLPCTNELVERVMTLPNGMAVTPADIQAIAGLIRFAAENGERIRKQVSG